MPEKDKVIVASLPNKVEEDCIYVIDQQNPNSYTHNYFKYPCKFIPEIPRWAINTYLKDKTNSIVLDPFAGSGTTLLEASLQNIPSVGAEIDNVAKLVIKVKTTILSKMQIDEIQSFMERISERIKENNISESEVILPEINNLNHWFTPEVLQQLGFIYYSILTIKDRDIVDFLKIAMASIIKRVSNADDISPKPYVSNKIKKIIPDVLKTFEDTVSRFISGMEELSEKKLAQVRVAGDATHIEEKDDTISLAVTSPPYINAFDYVRTMRLENLWLHLATEEELLSAKKKYLGTESICSKKESENLEILKDSSLLADYYNAVSKVDMKRALVMKKFFEEMKKNLQELLRVLKKEGHYIIVIGNSNIRNVNIESWKVLKDISLNLGFTYVNHIGYEIQNPYIRIPRAGRGGKIAIDHILILKK